MSYMKLNIDKPVQFISGGQFISEVKWQHEKRVIDSYEMIISVNETLYIEQNSIKYALKPGEILFIYPGSMHRGYRLCNPEVSFYWFHFTSHDVVIGDEMDQELMMRIRTQPEMSHMITDIYLPKYSFPIGIERINILANQLLDIDNSNYYTRMSMNYFMTSLLIELSEQTLTYTSSPVKSQDKTEANFNQILEWTRIHAFEGISVSDVAKKFNYHKDYLSRIFKLNTGKTLQSYLHALRMTKAKELLTGTPLSIRVIASRVGIEDEKYFMRLFKKYEKMRPTEYRRAFSKTHLNRL
ncbi:AraC family transcriptional regulator [Saliterribacillus persicus]|uniref:AraC family transcriptional regulator n=1 Tax=Saliterribacillus persicus TaxID=930114 RepID=A0A368YC30_9BACI|nr:AraC family transcriptional regulator [Saliterribacillus persicus]RCW77239.1 AraC family transcriptional regulator [Saliterribacillus persicus]